MFNLLNKWSHAVAPPAPPCRHIFTPAYFTGPETRVTCSKCSYTLIVSASMFGHVHVSEAK